MCHIPFSTLLLSYEKHGNNRKIFLQNFFCPSRSADCTWNWKHQTNNDHLNDLRLPCKLLGSLTHSPQSSDCPKDHYHWSQGLVQNLMDKMFYTGFSAQSLHRFVSVPACIIIALQQQLLLCFASGLWRTNMKLNTGFWKSLPAFLQIAGMQHALHVCSLPNTDSWIFAMLPIPTQIHKQRSKVICKVSSIPFLPQYNITYLSVYQCTLRVYVLHTSAQER